MLSTASPLSKLTRVLAIIAPVLSVSSTCLGSSLDLGVSAGALKRRLSDVDYRTSFAWQLNGELSFFPLLMAGPYATFTSAAPDLGGTPSRIDFRTLGLRLKLKVPVTDTVQPFGVAGAGWAHANAPSQVIDFCPTPGGCIQTVAPSATANFAEFIVGAGVNWVIVRPLALTVELDWRPSAGYRNDVYERQIQARSATAPDPSRNGAAWVGLAGISLNL